MNVEMYEGLPDLFEVCKAPSNVHGQMVEAKIANKKYPVDGVIYDFYKPTPIREKLPLPPFPLDALPGDVKAFVSALSASAQTDPGAAATVALGTLAICLQGKFSVYNGPSHTEPLSMYYAVVDRPGTKKSFIFGQFSRIIEEYEQQTGHTMLTNDTTSEALAKLMSENNDCIAVMSSEAGFFDNISMYTKIPNYDIWVKGYDGDSLYVNRISRKNISIRHATLSIVATLQPQPFESIMSNTQMRGRGLTDRFTFCFPNHADGICQYDTPPVPDKTRSRFKGLIRTLLAIPYTADPTPLKLSVEAYRTMEQYFTAHEHFKMTLDDNNIQWAEKYIGKIHRIAGALQIVTDPESKEITKQTLENAIRIGEYYKANELLAYSYGNCSPVHSQARFILQKIMQSEAWGAKRSDLYQICRSRNFSCADDMQTALELLEKNHYLKMVEPVRKGAGRRPDVQLVYNPYILGAEN